MDPATVTIYTTLIATLVAIAGWVVSGYGKRAVHREQSEVARLQHEVSQQAANLDAQLEGWNKYTQTLREEIDRINKTRNDDLLILRALEDENKRCLHENRELRKRVAQLERRLGIDENGHDIIRGDNC